MTKEDEERLEEARQRWDDAAEVRNRNPDPDSKLYGEMVRAHAAYLRLSDELDPGWRERERQRLREDDEKRRS